MKLKEKLSSLLSPIKDFLFPLHMECTLCGEEIPSKKGIPLCESCVSKLPHIGEKRCLRCGAKLSTESDFCETCIRTQMCFDEGVSLYEYEDSAKKLVLALKDGHAKYLAPYFGELLAGKIKVFGWQIDAVTFVPILPEKRRIRGYNQAEEIAKAIAEHLDVPCEELLYKKKSTLSQKSLSFEERQKNLIDSFRAEQRIRINGKRILLVDDIKTTGATLSECAKTLKARGAKSVQIASVCSVTYHLFFQQ